MGAAGHPAMRAARPAHRLGVSLRGDLPGRGQGRRPGHAVLRHRGHAGAPRRDQRHGGARRPRRSPARPGGLHFAGALVVPGNITLLPLPPRSPELNPVENVWQFMRDNWLSDLFLQWLRRHRRPLLRSLERPHRSALAHPIHRPTVMGRRVLINAGWYDSSSSDRTGVCC